MAGPLPSNATELRNAHATFLTPALEYFPQPSQLLRLLLELASSRPGSSECCSMDGDAHIGGSTF
jgi:hypothetical protein